LALRRHSDFSGLLLFALLCLAAFPSPLAATSFFKPFNATFSVSRGSITLGKLELEFTLDEQLSYSYHAHTQPGFLVSWFSGDEAVEESRGKIAAEVVVPENYSYRETRNEEDNAKVSFDWSALKAYTSSGGVTWAQEIEDGTQDRLSQQLMLRLELARGKPEVTYRVADGGKLKDYRFQVVGRERLSTPRGELECLKVQRSKASRAPDYTIWFAPELDYLPVKIERQQGSGLYRMVLKNLEGL
jgi:hypothetical protein